MFDMVKRATFWEIAVAVSLLVIACACGLAVAKEKLMLKYLPVDHDIEMVSQDYDANPIILTETKSSPEIQQLILDHTRCLTCRGYDQASQCPECCLYNNNASIHCQNDTDPDCPNPGPAPFAICSDTFDRVGGCGSCPAPCAKYPDKIENLVHCQKNGCPGTAAPNDPSCIPAGDDAWYCQTNKASPYSALPSVNPSVTNCSDKAGYTVADAGNDSLCNSTWSSKSTGHCWKYQAYPGYVECIENCTNATEKWEDKYYEYNNGTLGKKLCDYNCTSGFGDAEKSIKRNCDVEKCKFKIGIKCFSDYTKEKCAGIEQDYQEFILGGMSKYFLEIDPIFMYKFVARSGENYMAGWKVLCDVQKPKNDEAPETSETPAPRKDDYNFYTMIKVLDQENPDANNPVYESVIHQKSLGSTFYIDAQTGFPGLKPGHAYIIKLYYFLPWDGSTELEVDVKALQIILYRSKN
jgi:hypothetical protein